MNKKAHGFTIVELLIVIVVIAILAAISIVAYNGIQQRSRDSQRQSDIAAIAKAFELYYIRNGNFPATSGSTSINSSWSTTADASWASLESQLVPDYISRLPRDPISKQTGTGQFPWDYSDGYDYSIFSSPDSSYCGVGARQVYLIVYKTENGSQTNKYSGTCPSGNIVGPYTGSNYRVVKN